jgi:hypothetical protein
MIAAAPTSGLQQWQGQNLDPGFVAFLVGNPQLMDMIRRGMFPLSQAYQLFQQRQGGQNVNAPAPPGSVIPTPAPPPAPPVPGTGAPPPAVPRAGATPPALGGTFSALGGTPPTQTPPFVAAGTFAPPAAPPIPAMPTGPAGAPQIEPGASNAREGADVAARTGSMGGRTTYQTVNQIPGVGPRLGSILQGLGDTIGKIMGWGGNVTRSAGGSATRQAEQQSYGGGGGVGGTGGTSDTGAAPGPGEGTRAAERASY